VVISSQPNLSFPKQSGELTNGGPSSDQPTYGAGHLVTATFGQWQKIIIILKIAAQMVQQHYLLSNKNFP